MLQLFALCCTLRCFSCGYLLCGAQNHRRFHPPLSFTRSLSLSSSTFTPLLSSTSFECMAVYLAFVETASVLEDSPGINLPCLCQATDQQFTGHQLLGLLGACLTGVLCVWQGRAFTAGVVWALNTKTYQKYTYYELPLCMNYNRLSSVILLTVSFLFANTMPFGTWVDLIILVCKTNVLQQRWDRLFWHIRIAPLLAMHFCCKSLLCL